MKNKRLETIVDLVNRLQIETQEELIDHLREAGYKVTQATVSRDIRELKLLKVMTSQGHYKYIQPKNYVSSKGSFNRALTESIVNVDWVLNQVVLKTYPGMAQAIATAIDAIEMPDILGCVGGDDTIIVITRSEAAAEKIGENIEELIGGTH